MKTLSFSYIIAFLLLCINGYTQKKSTSELPLFTADNPAFEYTGRIDFSNKSLPKFWSPGVYIQARFRGTSCEIIMNDEVLYGNNHNYLEIVIDNKKPFRIQTTGKSNIIKAAKGLSDGEHTITICKNTESGNGYLEFAGMRCKALLPYGEKPLRKIEFIGNSITCGMGSDLSETPCDKGQWFDQHNAYYSYGAITARDLKAQWHLTAVSGIGLIRSCCNMSITMPQVYDKINLRADSIRWNFKDYQPQVVTVCLGQNDGIQDSAKFVGAYIKFVNKLRDYYPDAAIICLTSPMANTALTSTLKKQLTAVVDYFNKEGDTKVSKYFFKKRYYKGCGEHPNMTEHTEIAEELTAYIKKVKGW